MIEDAEAYLREMGLGDLRVRYHDGDLARLEVPADRIPQLADNPTRRDITRELRRLGFRFVTLDLEGFRSGSLNQMIDIQDLRQTGGKRGGTRVTDDVAGEKNR
jgi:uncharacterized protein